MFFIYVHIFKYYKKSIVPVLDYIPGSFLSEIFNLLVGTMTIVHIATSLLFHAFEPN